MQAIIFIGIQASGKTTFYRERFASTHIRLSLDMLRTRNREQILLRACLEAKQPFVIDNTNILASERAIYIGPARAAGFKVIGYFFRTELRAAIARNNKRTGAERIAVPGVIGKWKRLEPPQKQEGFHELHIVELSPQGEFHVSPWVEPLPPDVASAPSSS